MPAKPKFCLLGFVFLALSLLLAACGSSTTAKSQETSAANNTGAERISAFENEQQARTTVQKFYNNLNEGRYNEAYDLLTVRSKVLNGSILSFTKNNQTNLRSVKILNIREEIVNGAGASFMVYEVQLGVQPGQQTGSWVAGSNTRWVKAVNENGKWLIDDITATSLGAIS